jgi:hypothetical protein
MQPWELAAREAIRDLVARYNALGDRGHWDDLVALFAPNGEIHVPELGGFVGHEALRDFFTTAASGGGEREKPARVWHHTSTLVIDLEGQESAAAKCYYAVITGGGLDHWGRYRDAYTRVGSTWLFARRDVTVDGMVPGGWAALNLAKLSRN